MNEAKCVKCRKSDHSKPVTWVFVEYALGIGLCYDCDNGSNKRLFWEKKAELISQGKANTGKPARTSLSEDAIKEMNAPLIKQKKVILDQVPPKVAMEKAVKTPSPAPPVLPLGEEEKNNRVFKIEHKEIKGDVKIELYAKQFFIKPKKTEVMKTKIIWVVSTDDPTANDLMTIKSFVEHFSPGDEDIDIKTGKHRILVKNDKADEAAEGNAVCEQPPLGKKPLSQYMKNKLKGKKSGKAHIKPAKKIKSGAKLGAVNNSGWPSVNGRQPWMRCTGCGEYKGKTWINENENLHIGLCSDCGGDIDKKTKYDERVKQLESGIAA